MDIALIKALSEAGVESFEGNGVKITFHRRDHKVDSPSPAVNWASDTEIRTHLASQTIPKQPIHEPKFDPGLAQSMDAELEYDKVLNWSASPDPTELPTETPLTGDTTPSTQG